MWELNELAQQFASAHPAIASHLARSDDVRDPHLERIIEACAVQNARIRFELDQRFPNLLSEIAERVFPTMVRPIPSMAVVQFRLSNSASGIGETMTLLPGIALDAPLPNGKTCRFETRYPVIVAPLRVGSVAQETDLFDLPKVPFSHETEAVVRLSLTCANRHLTFADCNPGTLRLYLNGNGQGPFAIYDLLMNDLLGIVAVDPITQTKTIVLGEDSVTPAGLTMQERMMQESCRMSSPSDVLREYFTFPNKFLFFDLHGLDDIRFSHFGYAVDFYFYFSRSLRNLPQYMSDDLFQLGCTPVINLFSQRAESVTLNHREFAYRVIADHRSDGFNQIYSVDAVSAVSDNDEIVDLLPIYPSTPHDDANRPIVYWNESNNIASTAADDKFPGTDCDISIVDPSGHLLTRETWTLDVSSTCFNGDFPKTMAFGSPSRMASSLGEAPTHVHFLTAPTPLLWQHLTEQHRQRVILNLTLELKSLIDPDHATNILREYMMLFASGFSRRREAIVKSIESVSIEPITEWVGSPLKGGACEGTKIIVVIDENMFPGEGMCLLARVIETFYTRNCSLNSFCQVVVKTKARQRILLNGKPRSSELVISET